MAKVKDIRNFFNSRKEADTPTFAASATDDVLQSELLIAKNEIKKSTQVQQKSMIDVSEKIKTEVGTFALIHGTKVALERFKKTYPKYTFLRTSISNWKFKIKKDKEGKTIFKWKGRLNLLSYDLMAKAKPIVIGTRAGGTAINRYIVMAIENGVVKLNNPILLKENEGSLQL